MNKAQLIEAIGDDAKLTKAEAKGLWKLLSQPLQKRWAKVKELL